MTAPSLTGSTFSRADITRKLRLIMALDGHEKHGKTHFGLTGPKPLAVLSLDTGLEGVVEKHDYRQIYVSEYASDIKEIRQKIIEGADSQSVATAASTVWTAITKDYYHALREFRTLVLDTGTEGWELLRMARLGKLTQVMPHHYGPVNAEWSYLVKEAYDYDCNVIFIHRLKPDYNDKGNKLGTYSRAGMKDTGYLVQVNATSFRDADGFQLRIDNCRQNPDLDAEELPEILNTFPALASMVYPDTTQDDWA